MNEHFHRHRIVAVLLSLQNASRYEKYSQVLHEVTCVAQWILCKGNMASPNLVCCFANTFALACSECCDTISSPMKNPHHLFHHVQRLTVQRWTHSQHYRLRREQVKMAVLRRPPLLTGGLVRSVMVWVLLLSTDFRRRSRHDFRILTVLNSSKIYPVWLKISPEEEKS